MDAHNPLAIPSSSMAGTPIPSSYDNFEPRSNSASDPSPQTLRRLRKELTELQDPIYATVSAGPISPSNLLLWTATIAGPPDTPYHGRKFKLIIRFPSSYPRLPPDIRFGTKIFHPNISPENGSVCLSILRAEGENSWCPALVTSKVLLCVENLVAEPLIDDDAGVPLGNVEAGRLWIEDRQGFDAIAREWMERYAVDDAD